jgi:tol-pal system protein YbgF
MKLRAAVLPMLLLGLFAALPARAGLFDDEEARKQVADLRLAVDALTERVDGATKNQLDFSNQIESLRQEAAALRGQVEVLTNTAETSQKRQQDFYVDLDNRLRKLEAAAAPVAITPEQQGMAMQPGMPGQSMQAGMTGMQAGMAGMQGQQPSQATKADPQTEMRDYEAALGMFRESKFKEAQASFEAFIAGRPQSTLLPNATYWLGSSLYQQKLYEPAVKAFGNVAANWPNDAKAPDAMLKQADSLVGAKDVNGAVNVLETLIGKYPQNPAADTARSRIKTLAPKKNR